MKHALLILFVAAAPAAPAHAQGAGPEASAPVWTEADALAAFEAGSQALVDARAGEASAGGDLVQAGLRPNPQLTLSAGNLPLRANSSGSGNGPGLAQNLVSTLEVDVPFELGGKRRKRVAEARAGLASAQAATGDARRTSTFDVRRAFWNAVRARERHRLAKEVQAHAAEIVRITQARFANDDVSALDVEKVELEADRVENDLADAAASERSAVADLLALVGPGAPSSVRVQGALELHAPTLALAPLVARAAEARPDVRSARRAAEASRLAVESARAEAVPDLTVGVAYTHSRAVTAGDNPDVVALSVALPLPLFHRNQGQIAKAGAEAERASHAAAALESKASQEVRAAFARHAAAVEKVARCQGGMLARAERALATAERMWRAGDRSLLDLLEAQRTWIDLRGDYLDTLFELREARLDLERAVGAPLEGDRS